MTATDQLSRVFGALADPTRRDILTRLSDQSVTVGELASNYEMSRPAISQHLRVLERAGLVEQAVRAQWRECRVRENGLEDASQWIARHSADWNERFDLLEERIRRKKDESTEEEKT